MLILHDAGTLPYQAAWDLQLQLHEQVLSNQHPYGILMLVEHPPVITIGRHPGSANHLLAPPALLKLRGVTLTETDRGGDITFHGPGQLVAYPILPLNTYNLNLHSYMRLLEQVVIDALATFQIPAERSPGATGVWTHDPSAPASPDGLAKICALGIKVRRWVSFHGIALNVSTDLSFFDLINPCGLGRPVTSMQKLLAHRTPSMPAVKQALAQSFSRNLPAV